MFSVMSVCQSSCSRGVPTVQPPPPLYRATALLLVSRPRHVQTFQPGPHYTGMLSTLRYVQTFSTWTSLHRDALHSQICSNFFNLDLTTQGCSPLSDMFKLFQPGPHYTGRCSPLSDMFKLFQPGPHYTGDALHSQICSNFFNLDLTTQGCSPLSDMFKLFQPGPHYTVMLSTLRYVQTFSTWTSLHRDALHSQICSNFFNLDLTTQGCSPLSDMFELFQPGLHYTGMLSSESIAKATLSLIFVAA